MNYWMYKLQNFIIKAFEGLLDIIFFLPRYLYKNNDKFHEWIESRSSKSYKKRKNKTLAKKIFRDLDHQQECKVFTGLDSDHHFDFDYCDFGFEELLSDDKWIKKNKLEVEELTLIEYVEKYLPRRKYLVSDWRKDQLVYIITR